MFQKTPNQTVPTGGDGAPLKTTPQIGGGAALMASQDDSMRSDSEVLKSIDRSLKQLVFIQQVFTGIEPPADL